MNDTTVYAKTPAGQEEIGARKAGLDVRQRRLLILVDGQRSVAELRGVSGLPDALAVLEHLQSRGLVAATGHFSAAAAAVAAARAPATPPAAGRAGLAWARCCWAGLRAEAGFRRRVSLLPPVPLKFRLA